MQTKAMQEISEVRREQVRQRADGGAYGNVTKGGEEGGWRHEGYQTSSGME